MNKAVLIRIGIGALLVGAGLVVMGSARTKLKPWGEADPEAVASDIAAAGAEMAEPVSEED